MRVKGLILFVLSMLIFSGCSLGGGETTPVPTKEATLMIEGTLDKERVEARDIALAYLGEKAPPADLAWTGKPVTENNPPGWSAFQYTAPEWVVTIFYLPAGPEKQTYHVQVANQATQFQWMGKISDNQVASAPDDVAAARDTVLSHLGENDGKDAPPSNLDWLDEIITPPGLVGAANYRYTAQDWVIAIDTAVVPPEMRAYNIVVSNPVTQFHWEGQVNAEGRVVEPGEALRIPDPTMARDMALAYVLGRDTAATAASPLPELTWTEENITVQGLVGGSIFIPHMRHAFETIEMLREMEAAGQVPEM